MVFISMVLGVALLQDALVLSDGVTPAGQVNTVPRCVGPSQSGQDVARSRGKPSWDKCLRGGGAEDGQPGQG